MRASIRKNKLQRTKTFMRKRAYFTKALEKEDIEADEPYSEVVEEEEKAVYQENMLQTLKK